MAAFVERVASGPVARRTSHLFRDLQRFHKLEHAIDHLSRFAEMSDG